MAQYATAVDDFDKAYRNMIVEYTNDGMTLQERDVFHTILRGRSTDFVSDSPEQAVNQCRNVDPEGWMVHKSAFVENYINQLSSLRDDMCLCEIENKTESGLVVCSGISRARYTECVMKYTLTSLECDKVLRTWGVDKTRLIPDFDGRMRVLQKVSGCDAKGWLSCKHAFIHSELARRESCEASPAHLECILSSAVSAGLQNVRHEMHREIQRHMPFPCPRGAFLTK